MRLLIKSLFIFLFFTSYAVANGGGGGTDYKYVCVGYGDAQSGNDDPFMQGINEKDTECKNSNGCFINCFEEGDYDKLIDAGAFQQAAGGRHWFDTDKATNSNVQFYYCPRQISGKNNCRESGGLFAGYTQSCAAGCIKKSFVKRPASGGAIPEPEPEPEPAPAELIVEEINNIFGTGAAANTIYTKTTGSNLKVRIFHKDNAGSIGSGLDSAMCSLARDAQVVSMGSATYNMWSGGGTHEYEANGVLTRAGHYTLICTGEKDGKTVSSPFMQFYVAPASYTAELKITANGQNYIINSQTAASDGGTKKMALDSSVLPVAKVGEGLSLSLNGSANAINGNVDVGVNSFMNQFGDIKNEIQGLNATSGTRICQADAPTLPKDLKAPITNGKFNNTSKLDFDEVYKGKMTISYIDLDTKGTIEMERTRGGCSGSGTRNGDCPVPPTFEFSFNYLIVPNNFSVDIKGNTGSDIKVLYYGQGGSPLNEVQSKLEVVPLDASNKPLKNYVNGCAAIDTELELIGKSVAITFIDPTATNANPNSTTIRENEWSYQSNQSMANLSKILSVKQQDGNPYLPSMVAEPAFISDIKPLMYYTGKKSDPAYPQYNAPIFDSADNTVILRGRVNIIDTDNASNYSAMPTSKVYYEFYCQTCNLADISDITGVTTYAGSATSAGWWVDTTFNSGELKEENISATNGLSVSSVSALADGMQNISYDNAPNGKYEVTINQGVEADKFPTFLLYKPFYNGGGSGDISGGTSAFVTIYGQIGNDARDFGVDTGAAKNTRSGSRTGGF